MIPDTPSSAASEMGADHERIWLEPMAPVYGCEGRQWCQDKVWPDCDGDPEPTEYIRADLHRHALSAKDRELAEATKAKDGAYAERNQCVALIAKFAWAHGCRVGIAKTAIEGWDEAWHGCVYIDLPTGQVSWHYHDSDAHLFDFLHPYQGEWDGHSTPEKYARVNACYPIRPTELERARDEALAALREIATFDCGCKPCTGQCRKGEAAEIELEARVAIARSVLTPVSREQRGEEA